MAFGSHTLKKLKKKSTPVPGKYPATTGITTKKGKPTFGINPLAVKTPPAAALKGRVVPKHTGLPALKPLSPKAAKLRSPQFIFEQAEKRFGLRFPRQKFEDGSTGINSDAVRRAMKANPKLRAFITKANRAV